MRKKLKQFAGEKSCYAGGGGVGSGAPAKSRYVGHGKYKLAEGGSVEEGQNPNIGDDTRARALAWLAAGSPEREKEPEPAPKPRKTTVIIAVPKQSAIDSPRAIAGVSMQKALDSLEETPGHKAGVSMANALAKNKEPVRQGLRDRLAAFKESAPAPAPAPAPAMSADEKRAKLRGAAAIATARGANRAHMEDFYGTEESDDERKLRHASAVSKALGGKGFAGGGSVDGCAMRGKTRGKAV